MSDEQGHCLKTGPTAERLPRGSGAETRALGEPISFAQMLDIDANKLFFNEAAVLSMRQSMPS